MRIGLTVLRSSHESKNKSLEPIRLGKKIPQETGVWWLVREDDSEREWTASREGVRGSCRLQVILKLIKGLKPAD